MKVAYLLKAWRHHEHLSVREAAERLGIPSSTFAGIEQGRAMSGETLAVLWRWMLET
jgi:transcriptional regulator with XRE-family HTH domain